jgi:hypothetical protein
MKMRVAIPTAAMAALLLIACGQSAPSAPSEAAGGDAPAAPEEASMAVELPPVPAALLAAPNSTFTAFEPTEAGIIGAADIHEALGPTISTESVGEGETLHLTITETGETAVADIVRANMPDDAIASGHVRVEFHREPEGWFPTNAYRRTMCRRGAHANQWTTEPCP